jgi:hypothetical protein
VSEAPHRIPADTGLPAGAAKSRRPLAASVREARAWAAGRNPWIRLPLTLWVGWIFWHHLRDPDYASLIAGLNLGIHELGHLVFSPFGDFLNAAGGTLLQCIVPLIAMFMFRKQNDWFALSFAVAWLGSNLYGIAPYAADARARQLPLVSIGSGDPIHDWYFMLSTLHALPHDQFIGRLFAFAGTLCFIASLAFAAWLLSVMFQSRSKPDDVSS